MADKPRSPRDLLSLGLLILVALSLVFAASQLLRGAAHVLPVPPLDLTPEPGEETVDPPVSYTHLDVYKRQAYD